MPGQTEVPLASLSKTALSDPATPLAGIPVSVKDLFDVAGQVTTAGSTVLAAAAPAQADSTAFGAAACGWRRDGRQTRGN